MRARFYILLGVVAFLTAATQGLSQYPRGGGSSGKSSGDSSGKMSYYSDPSGFFDKMAEGKPVWIRAQMTNPMALSMFDRVAQRTGNTTGQITREQFVAYVDQRVAEKSSGGSSGYSRSPSSPGGPPGMPPSSRSDRGRASAPSQEDMVNQWAEGTFRRYDANGDGLLNYDEMPDTLRAERDHWDKNKDGFIDLNEYKEYFKARMAQRMAERGSSGFNPLTPPEWGLPNGPPPIEDDDRKPVVYRAGKLPKELPAWFAQLDTDNDGQIGLYEWKESGRSLDEFQEMDRNNDGFLTVEEVLRYEGQKKTLLAKAGNGPTPNGRSGAPAAMKGRGRGGPPGAAFPGGGRGAPPSGVTGKGSTPGSGGFPGDRPSSGGKGRSSSRGGSSSRGDSSSRGGSSSP
jgi:Ca2+-binding EF-hand superfamily protein